MAKSPFAGKAEALISCRCSPTSVPRWRHTSGTTARKALAGACSCVASHPVAHLGPDGVGFVVRRALARAGLCPPCRGSHLLRFSLATTMIRRGASMAEIGEVLRHRSPETTEIYAKVDFEALRAVALPWPGAGGAP